MFYFQKPVLDPPFIESYQRVCTYNESLLVTVKLPNCLPNVDPTYTYPKALRCDCGVCQTSTTECITSVWRSWISWNSAFYAFAFNQKTAFFSRQMFSSKHSLLSEKISILLISCGTSHVSLKMQNFFFSWNLYPYKQSEWALCRCNWTYYNFVFERRISPDVTTR